MNKDILRLFMVIFTTIFTLVLNSAASIIPLGGRDTGQISDSFNVLFVPAGYVFSIWSVIYLGLLAYTIFQALPAQRENPRLRASGWLVTGVNLLNGIWILCWHFSQFVLSVFVMFAILALLIALYLRLDISRARFTGAERWTIAVPFSIYLGWITVATIANITSVLRDVGWNGWGISEVAWTLIVLAAGVIIAGIMAFSRSDIAYLLVLVWAFVGISVRWLADPVLGIAGFAAAVLVLALLVISRLRPGTRVASQAA